MCAPDGDNTDLNNSVKEIKTNYFILTQAITLMKEKYDNIQLNANSASNEKVNELELEVKKIHEELETFKSVALKDGALTEIIELINELETKVNGLEETVQNVQSVVSVNEEQVEEIVEEPKVEVVEEVKQEAVKEEVVEQPKTVYPPKEFKPSFAEIVKYAPKATYVIVSNPVDIMTKITLELSGFDASRVIGSGTTLDTARLKYLISENYFTYY